MFSAYPEPKKRDQRRNLREHSQRKLREVSSKLRLTRLLRNPFVVHVLLVFKFPT